MSPIRTAAVLLLLTPAISAVADIRVTSRSIELRAVAVGAPSAPGDPSPLRDEGLVIVNDSPTSTWIFDEVSDAAIAGLGGGSTSRCEARIYGGPRSINVVCRQLLDPTGTSSEAFGTLQFAATVEVPNLSVIRVHGDFIGSAPAREDAIRTLRISADGIDYTSLLTRDLDLRLNRVRGGVSVWVQMNRRETALTRIPDARAFELSIEFLCPADINADGFVDFFDVLEFSDCFEGGRCPAGSTPDFNADGFIDFFDFDDFTREFDAAC
jgi:hypothetical protein